MDSAFQYIKANDGIDTEVSYPYEAKDDKCRFKRENVGATDTVSIFFSIKLFNLFIYYRALLIFLQIMKPLYK
jgi:hypothetical protein